MKRANVLALGIAFMLAVAASLPAQAHGGRYYGYGHGYRSNVHFGLYFGGPAYGYYPRPAYAYPYYYSPGYYAYQPVPSVVVAPPAPTTYIERGDANTPPEQAQGFWYYCPGAQAYYPYVKQCAGGWQRVTPQAPPGS